MMRGQETLEERKSMGWTDERIALLTKYWQEGRSASQIADALGEGLTRNAVIGKAHRLGLASRPSPLKGPEGTSEEAPRARKRAEPAPAASKAEVSPAAAAPTAIPPSGTIGSDASGIVPPPEARAAAPAAAAPSPPRKSARAPARPSRVTLLDLNDRICKWPIGHPDEPDFHFCGKPVSPGFPYCAEHCLVAYQSQLQRKDRPAGPPPPFRPNLPRVR
jgi:GcrA cell cycle regulator